MKIFQIVKRLNNTELGKGTTHDTYIRIPNYIDGDIIFNGLIDIEFMNKRKLDEKILVSYKPGREKRFSGLGKYMRDNNLNAGDEIILERRSGHTEEYYIDYLCFEDNIILQKSSKGFEILKGNINKLNNYKYKGQYVYIGNPEKIKKRKDSPDEITVYSFKIGDEDQLKNYKNKSLIELTIKNNEISIIVPETFNIYEMEVSN